MKTVIKNGLVVAERSTVQDILVEDGRIRALGHGFSGADETIDATGCLVVPGLVNSHIHAWQGFLRRQAINLNLNQYFATMLNGYGAALTPEDVALGIRLTALECLDAGVTTMVDWCHALNSPAHEEAAIAAHRETGMRTVFAYGPPSVDQPGWWYGSARPHPAEARALRKRLGTDGLLTMALGLRGPDATLPDTTKADFAMARELDVPATLHVGFGAPGSIGWLAKEGLLGPTVNLVHANNASAEELRAVAGAGASIAVTAEVEMQMGMGVPQLWPGHAAGVTITLGTDIPSAASSDMFSTMRFTLQSARGVAHLETLARGERVGDVPLTARDVFDAATAAGARAFGLRTGRIAEGYEADLAIVRTDGLHLSPLGDPLTALLHANPSDVAWVLVRGETKKRDGKLVAADLAATRARANERLVAMATALASSL